MHHTWLYARAAALIMAIAAGYVSCLAALTLTGWAKWRLSQTLDRHLHSCLPAPTQQAWPLPGAELPLGVAVEFPTALFATIAAFDSATFMPPLYQSRGVRGHGWAPLASTEALKCALKHLPFSCAPSAAPAFRLYLGEWRRLAEQASTLTINAASASLQGAAAGATQFCVAPAAAVKPLQRVQGRTPSRLAGCTTNQGYHPYLSAPWVF